MIKVASFAVLPSFNHQVKKLFNLVKVASSARSSGLYNSFHVGIFDQRCIPFEKTKVSVASSLLDSSGTVSVNVLGGTCVWAALSVLRSVSQLLVRLDSAKRFCYYSVNTSPLQSIPRILF